VSPTYGYAFHNRLTHSLKVAQLARRIAERISGKRSNRRLIEELGGLDVDAAETAGLAHDLGHPPFGHVAEVELNALVEEVGIAEGLPDLDGFEGNAQSFRIVTRLAAADVTPARPDGDTSGVPLGLNFTRASLNGILKYPWLRATLPISRRGQAAQKTRKWGAYRSERDWFEWARQGSPTEVRSLEAEIMDWADDITFSVHDLIDFYCAGRIPIHLLRQGALGGESQELKKFFDEVFARKTEDGFRRRRARLENALGAVLIWFPAESRYVGSPGQRQALADLTTMLISEFVSGIRLNEEAVRDRDQSRVVIDEENLDTVDILKQLTWHYVIVGHDLACEQEGQRLAVRTVFQAVYDASGPDSRKHRYLLPLHYRERIRRSREEGEPEEAVRLVVDYIASMSEAELMRVYGCLTGHPNPSRPTFTT
jgi:dGTPase